MKNADQKVIVEAIKRYKAGDNILDIVHTAHVSTAALYIWLKKANVPIGRRGAARIDWEYVKDNI